MPVLIPIEGSGDGPLYLHTVSAYGSVEVQSSEDYVALQTVDLEGSPVVPAHQSVSIQQVIESSSSSAITLGSDDLSQALMAAEISAGENFLILVDVVSEELAGDSMAAYAANNIDAQLLVNNTEVYIKSFQYQVPSGRLGSILSIRLAKPDVTLVPAGANIKFSLVVTNNGVTQSIVLMENGKLQEREYKIAYQGGTNSGPQDEVSFSSLDVISDKFGLAPRRPVVMFDPYRVRYDDIRTSNEQATRDEQGLIILPVVEPVGGLTMRQILTRAYTGSGGLGFTTVLSGTLYAWAHLIVGAGTNQLGTGFTQIVTNISDYPVRRADFTIESGWHSGAQPVVAMYAPVYFVSGTTLFIIDVDKPLPFGTNAHTITLSSHKSLSERIEFKSDTNAVLLTYQYNGNDPAEDPQRLSREVYRDIDVDEGEDGAGYYKTTIRRWDREFYMADTPDVVLDTLPIFSETETKQQVVWYDDTGAQVSDGVLRTTHLETIDYLYEGDLKVGHTRQVRASVADPSNSFILGLMIVERETCSITWKEDPNNPGVKLQDYVTIDIAGVCFYDPANTETVTDPETGETTFVRMIPALLAQSSGIIDGTWGTTGLIPIKTIRESLRNMKGNQYDCEVVEIDHINNTLKRSTVEPRTGANSNDPYEAKSRTVLIRDTVSEAIIGNRIPVAVNAYELPRARALELGRRTLRRLNNPLQAMPIVLAGVEFIIAQGSIIKGQKRSGFTTNYFVTGYAINGDNLGKKGHRIAQTLDAVELLDQD